MSQSPFVSVIIPNYNHARYLEERIQSVLRQTYQHFEVIILDDCSTDRSSDIIENYRRHPKIARIVYNESNTGNTFRQWRRGFELAHGDLIWIAESDDTCEPDLLEQLVNAYSKSKDVVVAYSLIGSIDSRGKLLTSDTEGTGKYILYKTRNFLNAKMGEYNGIYNASCALVRRDVALRVDEEYMTFRAAGDYLFWVKVAEQGDVVCVDKVLDYCRQHDSRVSNKAVYTGLSFTEDRKVYDYLVSKDYLTLSTRLKSIIFHVEWILTSEMESEEKRVESLQLWDSMHLFRKGKVRAVYWKLLSLKRKRKTI